MKKTSILIGLLCLFLSSSTFAACVQWAETCNDAVDSTAVPDDAIIQLLVEARGIGATKQEVKTYWIEQIKAWFWAFQNGITNKKTLKEANIEGTLTRIEMAKMLANYAINILKKEPDTSKDCSFPDVPTALDEAYDQGVTHACQLGIMGVGIDEFRPEDPVSRAEFATAIGRGLYKIKDGEEVRYATHLHILHNLWVIRNTNPELEELRWRVMIMLMRSAMDGTDPSYRVYEATPNFVGIVADPHFYNDTSIVFVYNPNTSWLPINQGVEIKSTWYNRWDLLQIEFDWKTEGAELWTYAKIWKISSIKSLWNVKDEYFKKRNNIPYELKYSWYQEKPIIDHYVYQWEIDWWVYVKNETWYTYTFNDLWIRISTPLGWRYQFPAADPYNLFVRNWVEIRKTWKDPMPPQWVEYLKIYTKDPNQSLKQVIQERHVNPGCLLESWILAEGLKGSEGEGYYITHGIDEQIYSTTITNLRCFPDDEDEYSVSNEALIQFFEPAKDKTRYYKVRFQSSPSIFGKIETL